MVVFLWWPLSIFLDVRGIIAWSWKWANFFGRSFFSLLKSKVIFLDYHFLSLLKSEVISLDDHFWSLRCFFFHSFSSCHIWYSWFVCDLWESLSAYTCLRVFSHLATFGWLTSSYGASSFKLRQQFTSVSRNLALFFWWLTSI